MQPGKREEHAPRASINRSCFSGGKAMNMTEIKKKAQQLGIQPGKMKKGGLIRAIQSKEGNFPCFESAKDYCDQFVCLWRKACLPVKTKAKELEKTKTMSLDKITAEMEALTGRLAGLKQKAQKTLGAGKAEALAEIHKLEKKTKELRKKTHELAEAGEDAWKTGKQKLDKTWKELQGSAKKAMEKFS
jgi:hypothetical protein